MSATAQQVLDNVRRILRDPNPGDAVVPDDTIKYHIDACVPEVADACSLLRLKTAGLVSLVAGTATYTLSAGEYDSLDDLYLVSSGEVLERDTTEGLAWRSSASGVPERYALEPQNDQTLDVTFYPTPRASDTVGGYYSVLPSAWGTAYSATSPTIPYSQRALRALELMVASAAVAGLNSEALVALKLDKGNAVMAWERRAAELLRRERLVISRLRSEHRGAKENTWLAAWRRS